MHGLERDARGQSPRADRVAECMRRQPCQLAALGFAQIRELRLQLRGGPAHQPARAAHRIAAGGVRRRVVRVDAVGCEFRTDAASAGITSGANSVKPCGADAPGASKSCARSRQCARGASTHAAPIGTKRS
ncbi:hypothetical protein [Burkholderia stagnalis]|uniref:hypothetical protein n=1 Tax=Burkholderia stagnalis TaxID=1503054 RepID=UPI00162AC0F9|nr:hypothetical protein [Burkholderia stagnalis]